MKASRNLLHTGMVALLIAAAVLGGEACGAQEWHRDVDAGRGSLSEIALLTGVGFGRLPEGRYRPLLLAVRLAVDLKRYVPALQRHPGRLSVFAEPQFNAVFRPEGDVEGGIGVGLQYAYPLSERTAAYLMGSIGPHYISVVTQRQADGFVWADTLGAGLCYRLTGASAIHAGYRFRHLSNAHLALPNGGINTHVAEAGYSLFFE